MKPSLVREAPGLTRSRYRAIALVGSLILVGCLGAEPSAPPPTGSSPEVAVVEPMQLAAAAPVDATAPPDWVEGLYWHVRGIVNGTTGSEYDLVVTDASAAGYVLDTTDAGNAAYDAMWDVSFVGRIGRDLAGRQGSEPVRFFVWPLVDGAAWTTRWDGLDVSLRATAAPAIEVPGGTAPGFRIEGTAGNAPFVSYTYVPALGWWSRIEWEEGYALEVTAAGWAFDGTIFRGEAIELLRNEWNPGPTGGPVLPFTLEASEHEARILRGEVTVRPESPGAIYADVEGPGGDGGDLLLTCVAPVDACTFELVVDLDPEPGEGKVTVASGVAGDHVVVVTAAHAWPVPFP